MGSGGSTLNQTLAIIEAARSETKQSKLDTLLAQKFEISTSQNVGLQLQDSKVRTLSDVMKNDSVPGLMKLLNAGSVQLNSRVGQLQLGLLHIGVYFGCRDILSTLVKNPGIDINLRNVDGDTPLMLSILTSETDAKAFWIAKLFAQNNRLSVTTKNGNTNFPIIASIRKGFKETSKFLISKQFIPQYTVEDITVIIKLALRFHEDEVLEVVSVNIGDRTLFEIFRQISHKTQLHLLAHALEKTMISNQTSGRKEKILGFPVSSSSGYTSHLDEKTSEDAAENLLKVGDFVQTLSAEAIKRHLPPEERSKDVEITRMANQNAIIHNILDDKVYVELVEVNCMAVIKSKSVILSGEGKSLKLGDESCIAISSFAKVIDNEDQLREFQGEKWKHGMEETCGKTGRVIRISKDNTAQVQFAWGARFYYGPKSLLSSTNEKAECRDGKNNWLRNGCPVRITKNFEKFASRQNEVGLPSKGPYAHLVGKLAQLGKFKIKPFAVQKIASVIWNGEEFNINVSAVTLITSASDSGDKKVRVGDIVMMRKDANVVRELQTPECGGWADSMLECKNTKGMVKDIRVNGTFDSSSLMLKVEFSSGTTFYFNPKCTVLVDQTVTHKKKLAEIKRESIRCTDKLGEGGFGAVYKGTWTMENGQVKTVAIKQMNYGVTSSNSYEDVLKEAKIQSELNHPNIVRLYGISYGPGQDLWLAMKLVAGRDLLSLLFPAKGQKKIEFPLKYKVKICMDMTYAIAFIHERGYLHADIKPQNMMVDQRTGNLYVCDFGITRYLGQQMDFQTYATKFTDSFGGTLLYVAPECLKQDKDGRYVRPTFKSDVWSLGATFYEIFTEKHLFDDAMLCLRCKTSNDTEYVQRLVTYFVPKEVRNVVKKTLEFAPMRRPNANDVSDFFKSL